jgi:hypothetical protein
MFLLQTLEQSAVADWYIRRVRRFGIERSRLGKENGGSTVSGLVCGEV